MNHNQTIILFSHIFFHCLPNGVFFILFEYVFRRVHCIPSMHGMEDTMDWYLKKEKKNNFAWMYNDSRIFNEI